MSEVFHVERNQFGFREMGWGTNWFFLVQLVALHGVIFWARIPIVDFNSPFRFKCTSFQVVQHEFMW